MKRKHTFVGVYLLIVVCSTACVANANHMAQYDVNPGMNPNSGQVLDSTTANTLQNYTSYLQDARILPSGSGIVPTSGSLHVINPGMFGVGDGTYVDVFYDGQATNFPTDCYLKLFYDFTFNLTLHTLGSIDGATVVGGGSAFLVNLSTRPPLGTIALLSTLDGAINPTQSGLMLTNVQVNHEATGDPFPGGRFDVYAQLHFDPGGTIVPGVRLMRITMTGEITPEPSTTMLAGTALVMILIRRRSEL